MRNLLPQQYAGFFRAFKSGKKDEIAHEISKMDNPLSKLIAIGLLVQKNKYDEMELNTCHRYCIAEWVEEGPPGLSEQASIFLRNE